MIKNLISSKTETDCVYLQCDCGNEIIKVYHYSRTSTCDEVLMLDYIGGVPSADLIKYKHINMVGQLDKFIQELQNCCMNQEYCADITDSDYILRLKSYEERNIKIELFHTFENKRKILQEELVWDIHVRVSEMNEFLELLNELSRKINEVNNNVTTTNQ